MWRGRTRQTRTWHRIARTTGCSYVALVSLKRLRLALLLLLLFLPAVVPKALGQKGLRVDRSSVHALGLGGGGGMDVQLSPERAAQHNDYTTLKFNNTIMMWREGKRERSNVSIKSRTGGEESSYGTMRVIETIYIQATFPSSSGMVYFYFGFFQLSRLSRLS